MNSIFDKTANTAMIKRINSLTSDSKGQWGKMTVDQMLKHSIAPIDFAQGKLTLKSNFLMQIIGRMIKNKVLNEEFKKNSPTVKEFVFKEKYDFENAQKELIQKFQEFTTGEESIKVENHPFFGKMTKKEWDILMWKHLDYHLRQFGV
jgi:hypothetical protein